MSHPPFAPETQMLGFSYKPELSEGVVKCPIFQTSTFVFKNAEAGKAFFEMAHGKPGHEGEEMGLIYSHINNPDMEILEERLRRWDEGEAAAAFSSGMSAISTTLLTFLDPGDVLLHSNPLYGGTHKFVHFSSTDWSGSDWIPGWRNVRRFTSTPRSQWTCRKAQNDLHRNACKSNQRFD